MRNSNSIRLSLLFMFLAILVGGCAIHVPNLNESLRSTKVRIDEAKKDKTLRRDSAQNLYEAELYWQRAWHARRDPAEANHLLFMAQGKIEMAKSLAALKKAEEQLASKREVPIKNNRNRRIAAQPDRVETSGTAMTSALGYDTTGVKTKDANVKGAQRYVTVKQIQAPVKNHGPVAKTAEVAAAPLPAKIEPKNSQSGVDRADPAPATAPDPSSSLQSGKEIGSTENVSTPKPESRLTILSSLEDSEPTAKTVEITRLDVESEEKPTKTEANLPQQSRSQSKEGEDIAKPIRVQNLTKLDSPATEAVDDAQDGLPQITKSTNRDPNKFFLDIPEYCRTITRMISGGKKVEQKCIDLELAAKKRLQRVQSQTAIYDYCGGVARTLGAGYQILEMCVEQELGSRPDNNETSQGFVLKDGEKNRR